MKLNTIFKSKNFLVINIALFCLVVGFAIGIACSTGNSTNTTAYALDSGISGIETLQSMQNSFRQVAQKVMPVVVKIDVVDIVKQNTPDWNSPFDFFFGPSEKDKEQPDESSPQEFRRPGLGSGVIVKRDGKKVYVLTNNHVVGEADEIMVTLNDRRQFSAKLVGADSRKDIALVVFETSEQVAVAELGNSDDLYVGDWALAIGNPMGLESTVTAGIISAVGREGGPEGNISDFIQTDAAINPGNSGGALVNIFGQVIGINTWIATTTGTYTGYGFALPINNAKKAIEDFISQGKVEYGWLGVSIFDPDETFLKDMGLAGKSGTFVANVFKGSPAEKGGIMPGDYIIDFNGVKIKSRNHLTNMIGDAPAGAAQKFTLIRGKETQTLSIKLTIRKEDKEIAKNNKNLWPGLVPYPLTDELRTRFKIEKSLNGVLIRTVDPETPGAIAGFKEGDIITKVNDTKISSIQDFYAAISSSTKKELMIKFDREGVELIIGLVK